jgi:hypothetical protein
MDALLATVGHEPFVSSRQARISWADVCTGSRAGCQCSGNLPVALALFPQRLHSPQEGAQHIWLNTQFAPAHAGREPIKGGGTFWQPWAIARNSPTVSLPPCRWILGQLDVRGVRRRLLMRRQTIVPSSSGLVPRTLDWALALSRGVRRGVIRAAAIAAMLAIYVATSIGSIGTSALGVAGISSVALLGTATPANAHRRWRRRRHRRRWHRGYDRGYYWGGPWRRRRRRRHGFGLYFHF